MLCVYVSARIDVCLYMSEILHVYIACFVFLDVYFANGTGDVHTVYLYIEYFGHMDA